jgi:hypothetical protein
MACSFLCGKLEPSYHRAIACQQEITSILEKNACTFHFDRCIIIGMDKKELVHGNLRIAFQSNYAPGLPRRYRELPEMAVVIRLSDGRQVRRIAESIKAVIEEMQLQDFRE